MLNNDGRDEQVFRAIVFKHRNLALLVLLLINFKNLAENYRTPSLFNFHINFVGTLFHFHSIS